MALVLPHPEPHCPQSTCAVPRHNGLPRRLAAWVSALGMLVQALLPVPALAAAAAPAAAAPPALDQLVLANRLAAYGLAQRDVLALITAAGLMQRWPGQAVSRTPVAVRGARGESTPPSTPGAAAKPAVHPRSAAGLLAQARQWAQGRADLLALIDDVAHQQWRGPTEGPRIHSRVATAHATDVYREQFKGGEPAVVMISGDGDSNLDLYVYNDRGTRLCASERLDDIEVCRWQPQGAGPFVIQIVNRGPGDNQYVMRSN